MGILDSQTMKTTVESGFSSGYDASKKSKGRKRHAVVDAMGLLVALAVHDADLQDRDGAQDVLVRLFQQFQDLVKLFADSSYTGEELAKWVHKHFADLEIVRKRPEQVGFVVHAKHWLVEHLFGWLERWRRLSKDFEVKPRNSKAFIYISLTGNLLARLERPKSAWSKV